MRRFIFYQTIGRQTIIHACSSAMFVICRSPVYGFTSHVKESHEHLDFILKGGLCKLSSAYHLELDTKYIAEQFIERAYYKRDVYYENTSI